MKRFFVTIRCNKDLVNQINQQDFTMGKYYEGSYVGWSKSDLKLSKLVVRDDQNCPHVLGTWSKHFRIINN